MPTPAALELRDYRRAINAAFRARGRGDITRSGTDADAPTSSGEPAGDTRDDAFSVAVDFIDDLVIALRRVRRRLGDMQ